MDVSSKWQYHIFYVLHPFVVYFLILRHIIKVMGRLYGMYMDEGDSSGKLKRQSGS
jgi:hypothetical protein